MAMADYGKRWKWAAAIFLAGILIAGCNRKNGGQPQAEASDEPAADQKGGDEARPKAPVEPRFRQPFAEATRAEPPPDCRPPDTTLTGKSTGHLFAEVKGAWDSIPLVDDDGKLIPYRATLETKLGSIEITLRPDLAPNHVRNFIALARAGYYDGLLFEQIVRQQDPDQPEIHLDIIEAGCPTGTGEAGFDSLGSIGYWLKDEFKPEAEHEEGTVGACHGIEADTAACRFYITLCKAPQLNGNFTVFGKVTKGLDVVRTISLQPVRIEEQDTDGYHKPDKPVVIDKVTIQVGK
jgi:cyclophilin family peptidyl-prolyl cis-trans isomerase